MFGKHELLVRSKTTYKSRWRQNMYGRGSNFTTENRQTTYHTPLTTIGSVGIIHQRSWLHDKATLFCEVLAYIWVCMHGETSAKLRTLSSDVKLHMPCRPGHSDIITNISWHAKLSLVITIFNLFSNRKLISHNHHFCFQLSIYIFWWTWGHKFNSQLRRPVSLSVKLISTTCLYWFTFRLVYLFCILCWLGCEDGFHPIHIFRLGC